MKKTLVVLSLMFMAVFAASDAFAVMTLEGRYWFSNLDGKLRISSGAAAGTEIDPVGDLGFEKKMGFAEVRASLGGSGSKLRYAFTPLKWDGSKLITRTVVFQGKTYAASTLVNSELKINYHRLGYEYDFYNALDNKFGFIFDIKYFDINASVDAPAIGLNESKSIKAAVPTVGFTYQQGMPYLMNVGAEVTGVKYSRTYFFDGEVMVSIKPAPFFSASIGYRVLKLHIAKDNDLGVFNLKGPFAALRADF